MVVTGGGRGIGAAVVRMARGRGARVAVLDVQAAPGDLEVDCYARCDVSRADDVRDALECFGATPVDLLAIGPFVLRRDVA